MTIRSLMMLGAACCALALPQSAQAAPIGRGSLTALVGGDNQFCMAVVFEDQTYSVFDADINLGTSAVSVVLTGQLDTGAQTGSFSAVSSPDATQLAFAGTGAYDASNFSAIPFTTHQLDSVSGSAVLALGTATYSIDGIEACGGWDNTTTVPGCTLTPPYVAQCTGSLSLNAFRAQATSTGANVSVNSTVSYFDVTTGTSTSIAVGVSFDEVYGAGTTTITAVSATTGVIPQNFSVEIPGFNATFFDVSTTAEFVGPIEICSNYDDADDDGIVDGTTVEEGRMRLLHGEGDAPRVFVDRTSRVDPIANLVCAEVPSLSFFVQAITSCGNGSIDSGEQCDDAQSTPSDGDGCSAHCQIETCYQCSGTPSLCTPNSAPCDDGNACTSGDVCSGGVCSGTGGSGSACDDGNACTEDDECVDGICTGLPLDSVPCDDGNACTDGETCSAGTCTPPAVTCDDADPCTADACNPLAGCVHGTTSCSVDADPCTQDVCLAGVGCGHYEVPATSCKVPEKSSLLLSQSAADDTKDKLVWKWSKGAATNPEEVADPTQTASYALCVYDGSGILGSAEVAAGGTCNDKACWKAGSKGKFQFKDKTGAQGGITKLDVAPGSAGKAKVTVGGKGTALFDPSFPISGPVAIQLHNQSTGACFGAAFSGAQITKNDAVKGQFKAKAP